VHLPAIGRAAEKPVIPSAPFSAAYFAFWQWVLSEVAMVLLPTFCPACSGFTMKVVKYGLDDSYEARCTARGYNSFGKISPELLIVKGAVDSYSPENQLRQGTGLFATFGPTWLHTPHSPISLCNL
jgi:hypothetical protein